MRGRQAMTWRRTPPHWPMLVVSVTWTHIACGRRQRKLIQCKRYCQRSTLRSVLACIVSCSNHSPAGSGQPHCRTAR
jgi:hypothetical protein